MLSSEAEHSYNIMRKKSMEETANELGRNCEVNGKDYSIIVPSYTIPISFINSILFPSQCLLFLPRLITSFSEVPS